MLGVTPAFTDSGLTEPVEFLKEATNFAETAPTSTRVVYTKMIGNTLFNHMSTIWSYTTGNVMDPTPAIADVNNDGHLDVVVGCHNGRVFCIDENGTEVWNRQVSSTTYVRTSPCVADIDNDGNLEVLVGSDDYNLY